MGSLGLGLGGLALRRRSLAAWTPAKLAAPTRGGWFNFSNSPTVTTSGGNITSITDSYGTAKSLSANGTTVPLGTDPTGKKFAELRSANSFPLLNSVGSGYAPTTANAPFSLVWICRFKQAPTGNAYAAQVALGGQQGSPNSLILGSTATGIGGSNVTQAALTGPNQSAYGPFGSEQLADGTAGSDVTTHGGSQQCIAVVYDGSTLTLWVDGVLQPNTLTSLSTTLGADALSLGYWFFAYGPADSDTYELLALDYALSDVQVKQVAKYAVTTYGFPATATKLLCLGDSFEQGFFATNNATTSYNAQLARIFPFMFGVPITVANLGITSTLTSDWLTGTQTFAGLEWQRASRAIGFSPRAVANHATVEWAPNEAALGVALATFEANSLAAYGILKGWGFTKILRASLTPCDATAAAALPVLAANHDAYNAWMRGAGMGVAHDALLDWDATSDATAIPGLAAWDAGTAYSPPPAVPPQLVTYAGSTYYCLAGSTGVTPGTDATKWLLAAPGGTFGTLATALGSGDGRCRGDTSDEHLGTDGAPGNFGPCIYATGKAVAFARMLGLM